MKKSILFLVAVFVAAGASAQMSKVWKAKELMDDEEFKKAQEMVTLALQNVPDKNKPEAYNIAGTIESRLMQGEIEKAQAKQPLDTVLFINSLTKAVEYFEISDKYDMKPNEKGKVKAEFHANNRQMMMQMLTYFAYAGQFQNQRGDKKGAYEAFSRHLELAKSPVFTKHEQDSLMERNHEFNERIGYYAALIANDLKDYDGVLKNVDWALKNPDFKNEGYIMKTGAMQAKQDTAGWVTATREAMMDINDNPVYCDKLLSYYYGKGMLTEAMEMANKFIETSPENKLAYYARGCVQMEAYKKYDEARKDFEKAIELDDSFAKAIYNHGVCYVNELIALKLNPDPKDKDYKEKLEKVHSYYRKALPDFERVRLLLPDNKEMWGRSLHNVYYNLDMKDKVKEMEELLGM